MNDNIKLYIPISGKDVIKDIKPVSKEFLEDCDCHECLFYDKDQEEEISLPCRDDKIIKWLYEEYNPKTQLTIEEIEDLLKDKYPNGIELRLLNNEYSKSDS